MHIIINDANILIDIANLDIAELYAELEYKLFTTDFVINEIENPVQLKRIERLFNSKKIEILTTSSERLFHIYDIYNNQTKGLSVADCSVWYYSKHMNAILCTGDGNLRKQAKKDNIEVRGILFIFDELLQQEKITYNKAIEKLKNLKKINVRLPAEEIQKRLDLWKKKHNKILR